MSLYALEFFQDALVLFQSGWVLSLQSSLLCMGLPHPSQCVPMDALVGPSCGLALTYDLTLLHLSAAGIARTLIVGALR